MIDWLWEESTNEVIRGGLGPIRPMIDLFTHLGDGPVLIAAAILLYWFGAAEDRRDRAFVVAVGTAAFALAAGIKGVFQLPRPAVAFAPEAYPGYTFPSAHAMGAAAFYGSLAVIMQAGRPWQRYAVAGAVIVLVAVSRVTWGVHFLGDVIVGAVLGLLLVWIGLRWQREGVFRPGAVFLLAGVIALVTVALGSREYVSMVIGAGFGGAVGWWWVANRETTDRGAAILLTGVGLLFGLGAVRVATAALTNPVPGAADPLVFVGEVVAYGVLTALIMALPALAVAVEDGPTVRRLQETLPFRRRQVDLDGVERRR